MANLEREEKVFKDFAERLHRLCRTPVDIIAWPDEEHPGQGYWDATLQRDGQDWILDHTQFGSFEEHFRDDAFFKEVLAPLETELPEHFPEVYIWVSIDVGSIPKGNRAAMHKSLLKALIDEIPGMPDDEHIEHMKPYTLPDVPFTVYVSKTTEESPGCHVMRVLPSDRQEQLIAGLAETLRKKEEQFTRFKSQQDSPTLLLLDTDDFTSLNEDIVRKAFCAAQERVDTPSIDEVYLFFRKGGGSFLILPLKNSEHSIPDKTEWREYKRAQRVITWGWGNAGPPHLT